LRRGSANETKGKTDRNRHQFDHGHPVNSVYEVCKVTNQRIADINGRLTTVELVWDAQVPGRVLLPAHGNGLLQQLRQCGDRLNIVADPTRKSDDSDEPAANFGVAY
jgi:hypothetical protein